MCNRRLTEQVREPGTAGIGAAYDFLLVEWGTDLLRLLRLLAALLAAVFTHAYADVPIAQLVPFSGALTLGRFVEVLEDPGGRLTLEDVRGTQHASRFMPSGAEHLNFGYSRSAWWLRFCLRGDAGTPPELLLEARFPSIDALEVYSPRRDAGGALGYVESRGGDLLPWDAREFKHRSHVFRLAMPARRRCSMCG